ncbi:hypothetical protein [Actinomadura harenae]|uniref:Antitoxin Xre/MbcA/ParS-like toxin-binding domain-containing protein n=1 Tax=Actinomadura harenae TaxID=2483351 RepID=A0A3M2LL98_9ACTN|nr:hypothetical protein [Actinomadura harenae]RMI38219.1 hypothetical protein EBO15_33645 [Actinomadura harenae]
MSRTETLDALRRQALRLRPGGDELRTIVLELAEGADPDRAWNRLTRLLLRVLPRNDALAGLLVEGADRTVDTAPSRPAKHEWEEIRALARELLAALDAGPPTTAEIIAMARSRLLEEPARAIAAAQPGLLVLTAPDGSRRAPEFQFDRDGAVRPVAAEINRVLGADRDPWGVADWWLSPDSALGGRVPARLIGVVPDELLARQARALLEEI